jgi:hypothetical protein
MWSLRPPGETLGGVPLVLGEHGSEVAPIPPTVGILGLIVFDIASAAHSANRHNLLNPDNPVSPKIAVRQSLFWTVVPLAVAVGMGNTTDAAIAPAILLGTAAVVIGPSMGHFYSDRTGRGLLTAGLRLGLGTIAMGLAWSAS